jgi:uncharacterized protein (DUF488 family)
VFDFVPYRYGCFSFQANQDVSTLKTYGYITSDEETVALIQNDSYLSQLTLFDRQYMMDLKGRFSKPSKDDLIKYTYVKYPYYATKSEIAKKILTGEEWQKVQQCIPHFAQTSLFTIGYEGVSLEEYINRLIRNDVRVLCDVRKNAFSYKYGFSKKTLEKACARVGITYMHMPDLGIVSEERKSLHAQADYDVLFEHYKRTVLRTNTADIARLFGLLQKKGRIALTCFEANIDQCHRKHVAEAISRLPDFEYELKHI